MSGIVELGELLESMSPQIDETVYVFCTVEGASEDYAHLQPISMFVESEGLTLIIPAATAETAGIEYEGQFKRITLTVHSSLEAVGLTAAVATKLTSVGISANVVAAYYHDHVFVQVQHAEKAMQALRELAGGV